MDAAPKDEAQLHQIHPLSPTDSDTVVLRFAVEPLAFLSPHSATVLEIKNHFKPACKMNGARRGKEDDPREWFTFHFFMQSLRIPTVVQVLFEES